MRVSSCNTVTVLAVCSGGRVLLPAKLTFTGTGPGVELTVVVTRATPVESVVALKLWVPKRNVMGCDESGAPVALVNSAASSILSLKFPPVAPI